MTDQRFDDLVKSALQDYKVSEVRGWEELSEKVSSSDLQNQAFDSEIQDTFQGYEVPFNISHWELFKSRLELQDNLRVNLYIAKSMETVIILLLVFSFWNLASVRQSIRTNTYIASTVTDDSNSLDSDVIINGTVDHNESVSKFTDNVEETSTQLVPIKTPISQSSAIFTSMDNSFHTEEELQVAQPPIDIIQYADTPVSDINLYDDRSLEGLGSLASIYPNLQNLGEISLPVKTDPLLDTKRINSSIWLNTYIRGDNNIVNSSYDNVYDEPAYQARDYGLTGGVSVTIDKGIAGLETGIQYSTISYRPRLIVESYSRANAIYETSLQRIFFNVVSVPLNIQLNYLKRDKVSLYAQAGSSLNMIINSHYSINDQFKSNTPTLAHHPKLEQKDFHAGFFEGGSFYDNTFLTINLALGINIKLSESMSIFGQPSYSHNINLYGLGPNKDWINSLSMGIGTRFRIDN